MITCTEILNLIKEQLGVFHFSQDIHWPLSSMFVWLSVVITCINTWAFFSLHTLQFFMSVFHWSAWWIPAKHPEGFLFFFWAVLWTWQRIISGIQTSHEMLAYLSTDFLKEEKETFIAGQKINLLVAYTDILVLINDQLRLSFIFPLISMIQYVIWLSVNLCHIWLSVNAHIVPVSFGYVMKLPQHNFWNIKFYWNACISQHRFFERRRKNIYCWSANQFALLLSIL